MRIITLLHTKQNNPAASKQMLYILNAVLGPKSLTLRAFQLSNLVVELHCYSTWESDYAHYKIQTGKLQINVPKRPLSIIDFTESKASACVIM